MSDPVANVFAKIDGRKKLFVPMTLLPDEIIETCRLKCKKKGMSLTGMLVDGKIRETEGEPGEITFVHRKIVDEVDPDFVFFKRCDKATVCGGIVMMEKTFPKDKHSCARCLNAINEQRGIKRAASDASTKLCKGCKCARDLEYFSGNHEMCDRCVNKVKQYARRRAAREVIP